METPSLAAQAPAAPAVPFGVNEVRLSARLWLATFFLFWLVVLLTPRVWKRIQRFDAGPDYRMPYELSKDYWLYEQRLDQVAKPGTIVVLGDSVVWGEYVLPNGTLSHFLNQQTGQPDRFINGGINGLFPLAEEGLINYYSGPLRHQKVIVHCNLLWMTSPKADLSTEKEDQFNHSRLVPQFSPWIPCYKANANERLSTLVQREVGFLQWVGHLQNAYFGQKSILSWTLEDDGGNPPHYPNAYRNPLAQISLTVPSPPADVGIGAGSIFHLDRDVFHVGLFLARRREKYFPRRHRLARDGSRRRVVRFLFRRLQCRVFLFFVRAARGHDRGAAAAARGEAGPRPSR